MIFRKIAIYKKDEHNRSLPKKGKKFEKSEL